MSEPTVPPNDPLSSKSTAWSGRFEEPVADFVLRYTASVGFDQRLAAADIEGSLAHAAMLARARIISDADLAAIERGLAQIRSEIERGTFEWHLDLEDVHLNIEKRLTDLVGDAGKRLHTGRSRNDQVATDLRLWLRGEARPHRRSSARLAAVHWWHRPSTMQRPSCRASRTCRWRSP